jgi:hypothetical protein
MTYLTEGVKRIEYSTFEDDGPLDGNVWTGENVRISGTRSFYSTSVDVDTWSNIEIIDFVKIYTPSILGRSRYIMSVLMTFRV